MFTLVSDSFSTSTAEPAPPPLSPANPHLVFFRGTPSTANPHILLRLAQRKAAPPPPKLPSPPFLSAATDPGLTELRAMLSPAQAACSHCTDETLQRYLHAYPKKERAYSALSATLEWRAERGYDAPSPPRTCHYCAEEPNHACFFSLGQDAKRGWEVFYSCPPRSIHMDVEKLAHHTFLQLERALERSPKYVLLVDLHGMGMRDLDPRTAVGVLRALLSHYPGRLGQGLLLDMPWLFTWELLRKVMNEETAAKVLMLSGTASHSYFDEWLTPAQATFMKEVLEMPGTPGSFPKSIEALRVPNGTRHVE